jgi:hypothetical protein
MRAKETACIVVSFIIVAGAFAHDRALASAQNVLNVPRADRLSSLGWSKNY